MDEVAKDKPKAITITHDQYLELGKMFYSTQNGLPSKEAYDQLTKNNVPTALTRFTL